ncbi:gnat family [Neofusicoccum parvum]|uniref:Gnat family n=1 Tax=Neofusicoccum parvum TaxID=310453 RepID=A0ACB5S7E4_9PEZI|nr:gnat family [Neofusicoccum parvum]
MAVKVSRMAPADIDGAIVTIQEAFKDDPYSNWVFDKSEYNPVRNHHSLTLRCHWGIKHGLFYVAKDASSADPDKVLGTAMWMAPTPPSQPDSWSLWYSNWLLWFQQGLMNLWFGRGGLRAHRYWIWKDSQAKAQAELWTSEKGYYFCNIVTILPEHQGKGIGRALMEEVLQMADEQGVPAYLESSRKDPNVPIYEKFGFELQKEMECDDEGDAIMLYCMARAPKGASGGAQNAGGYGTFAGANGHGGSAS